LGGQEPAGGMPRPIGIPKGECPPRSGSVQWDCIRQAGIGLGGRPSRASARRIQPSSCGSRIGCCFEFVGHDNGLLDDQSLQRREAIQIRREHECIIIEVCSISVNSVNSDIALYPSHNTNARIRWCTRSGHSVAAIRHSLDRPGTDRSNSYLLSEARERKRRTLSTSPSN
jgi:hypothetical protein